MARYSLLLGRRVEVHYRAGDIYLPATGTLVADSGKSIFLEEHLYQQGRGLKTFRWEIPYQCIFRLSECGVEPASPELSAPPGRGSEKNPAAAPAFPFRSRPEEA